MIALMTAVGAAMLGAQVSWPIECDNAEGWTPQPGWLSNPTTAATVSVEDGVLTFAVSEPWRGMKWSSPVEGLNAEGEGYLLVRCRAENARTEGTYVLWGFGTRGDGTIIPGGELPADGQWHEIAVDLFAQGHRGRLHTLAVELQAGDVVPARLSFDYLRIVDAVPEEAIRLPTIVPQPFEWREEFEGRLAFKAQRSWLGNPAPEGQYALAQTEGRLLLRVSSPNAGMKWSAQFDEPVNAAAAEYVTIRYRAQGVQPWGDYFVWVGSESGGQPKESATLLSGAQIRADGRWHIETLPVEKRLFPIKEIAVQLQASRQDAWAEIDYVMLSSRRPLLPIRDLISFETEWHGLRADRHRFVCVSLAGTCNASGAEIAPRLGIKGWFGERRVTVEGVPFELPTDGKDVVVLPRGSHEPLAVPVEQRADELFLLLGTRLPAEDWSGGLGAVPMRSFSQPGRFRIAVDYADGVTDWHFPARAFDGAYEVCAGLDVYALTGLRPKRIQQIRLRSAMKDCIICLAGMTAYRGPALTQVQPISFLPPPTPERAVEETPPSMRRGSGRLTLRNAYLTAEFDFSNGLRLESIRNQCLREGEMSVAPGPLFVLSVGEKQVDSTQVAIGEPQEERQDALVGVTLPVDAQPTGLPLAGEFSVRLGAGPELHMTLTLKHVGHRVIRPGIIFPQVSGIVFGNVEDTWYLYAARGGIINNRPFWASEPYSGRHPLQITDVFSPKLGGGLYMMVQDLDGIYKYHVLRKDEQGAMLRVDYFQRDYQPGDRIEIAPVVFGAHTGDWRAALNAYKRWAHTWYKPVVPRKPWFHECFNYRQHLVRGGLYDFATQTYHMNEALEKDREFFGRVDYFHIFDFGESSVYGRVGDYSHYDEIGGREKLAEAIRQVQATGTRVGLYIEGYLVDERGEFGRDHVGRWHIIQADGQPLLWPGAPTEHMMCPAVEGWQDYLASTYKRVASELSPDGMYIDQHGFADPWKICYSPDHGHPVPQAPLRGERQMGQKIRAAVPDTIATLTEEVPVDVTSQYQDGALGYSVWQGDRELAPHRIHLFRFCFPDFKVFQLVSYNPFIDGGWELLQYPFFNGEGTWLGNSIPGGFDADAQTFLQKAFAILHEHREAFTSHDVEALVPTQSSYICANRFSGPKETVWTLLNVSFRTYRGPVLRVPHRPGARYLDLWGGRVLTPNIEDGKASIETEIGPREVGCVAQQWG